MKRLIALLIAAVFCVTMLCPPVSAVCPDPENPGRWVMGGNTPSGDESGWHDPESPGGRSGIVEVLSYFKVNVSKYFVVFFIAKKTVKQTELSQ